MTVPIWTNAFSRALHAGADEVGGYVGDHLIAVHQRVWRIVRAPPAARAPRLEVEAEHPPCQLQEASPRCFIVPHLIAKGVFMAAYDSPHVASLSFVPRRMPHFRPMYMACSE